MNKIAIAIIYALFLLLTACSLTACNPNINRFSVEMEADNESANVFIIEANGSSITTTKKSDANGDLSIPLIKGIKDSLTNFLPNTETEEVKTETEKEIEHIEIKTIETGRYHGKPPM